MAAVIGACRCAARMDAQRAGEFLFSLPLGGFAFVDAPKRRMSWSARYYAAERGVENHTGEEIVWHCCPWCGGDLPHLTDGASLRDLMGDDDPD